jgi:hypothetical protein
VISLGESLPSIGGRGENPFARRKFQEVLCRQSRANGGIAGRAHIGLRGQILRRASRLEELA